MLWLRSQLWCRFYPWLWNVHIPEGTAKKKKKKGGSFRYFIIKYDCHKVLFIDGLYQTKAVSYKFY